MAWSNTWPWTALAQSDMPSGAQSQASIFQTVGSWINALAGNVPVTAAGQVQVTPTSANTAYQTGTIAFPANRFTVAPVVLLTPATTAPGAVLNFSVSNVTTTGFLINVIFTSTTTRTINWLAVLSP